MFVESVSFVVIRRNAKRSMALGLCDGDKLLPAGNVTIPPNHAVPASDEVVECSCLHASSEGGSIHRPRSALFSVPGYSVAAHAVGFHDGIVHSGNLLGYDRYAASRAESSNGAIDPARRTEAKADSGTGLWLVEE